MKIRANICNVGQNFDNAPQSFWRPLQNSNKLFVILSELRRSLRILAQKLPAKTF
jgi:hypothetical protein